jgi:hypothetical protein
VAKQDIPIHGAWSLEELREENDDSAPTHPGTKDNFHMLVYLADRYNQERTIYLLTTSDSEVPILDALTAPLTTASQIFITWNRAYCV